MSDDSRFAEQKSVSREEQYASETKDLQFVMVPIKFYPEDLEKMEGMSLEEQVEFIRKLKQENRYTYPEGTPEEYLHKLERDKRNR